MELNHLHVAQRQPGAKRHREPVARLVTRGRVIAVHRRTAAGREHDRTRADEHELARADVDQERSGNARSVARRNERDRAMLLEALDRACPHLLGEPVDDLDTGEVALVHGAIEGLAGEGLLVQRAVGVAVEEAAELVLEFANALDRPGDEAPCELLVREPLSAFDRVHEVTLDRIAFGECDVVAALHHPRAATLAEQPFHRDGDRERRIGVERVQGREQARSAATEDEDVGAAFDHRMPSFASTAARRDRALASTCA